MSGKNKAVIEYLLVTIFFSLALFWLFINSSPHHAFSGVTFDLNWTISDTDRIFAGNDIGDYSTVAHAWYKDGQLPNNSVYSFRAWAPGIYWLIALPLFLFGEETPFLIFLSYVNAAIWLGLLVMAYHSLRGKIPLILCLVLPFAPFILPEMRDFVLRAGVLNSDSYGSTSFALASISLLVSFQRKSRNLALVAAFMFTLSAYMRASHEPWVKVMMIALAMIAYIEFLLENKKGLFNFRLGTIKEFFYWVKPQPKFRTGFLILLVIILAMLPWRIHNLINDGRISWAGTVLMEIPLSWLQRPTDHWYYLSGGTVSCRVDPVTCEDFNKRDIKNIPHLELGLSYARALLTNPFSWAGIKLSAFAYQWTVDYGNADKPAYYIRCVLLFLLALLPTLALYNYSFRGQRSSLDFARCWLALTICGYLFVLIMFAHIESRYLFSFKLVVYYWLIFEIANFYSKRKTLNNPDATS